MHCGSQDKPFISTYSSVNGKKIVPCSKIRGSELVHAASERLCHMERNA